MNDPIPISDAANSNETPGAWNRTGVILLAHGAPDRLEDVPEFLLRVRGGRPLPERAVKEISRRYQAIGGSSPLLRWTNLQAAGLAIALNSPQSVQGRLQAETIPVLVGMRNWKPFIADAVQQLGRLSPAKIIAVCLAPQNSRTSVGLYRKALAESLEKTAPAIELDFIESWHDQPELIAAYQDKLLHALRLIEAETGNIPPVILTAHSVPTRTIEAGDPYEFQVRETARLVVEGLGLKDWRVAFQSQGMSEEPWIGPTVESEIDLCAAASHRHVMICPVGFVSDHVEVLYDIDIAFKNYGVTHGVSVHRSESLNDSPLFIEALATLVQSRLVPRAAATALPSQP